MNPLRKYTPRDMPKDPIHPVDVLINLVLWCSSLGVVICVLRLVTKA